MTEKVFIGCGAGFAGDRIDAAIDIVRELKRADGPRFLIFEMLAERTLALSQMERRRDPTLGYNPSLEALISPILYDCLSNEIKIVSNFGAANPHAAAALIDKIAQLKGINDVRIAIVEGDDVLDRVSRTKLAERETDGSILQGPTEIVSANVYLGAGPIVEALNSGADIVITGRVADPSLALGPLMHCFSWRHDDWQRLASGTLVGHLLECGSQVTGGYFADPGVKDVSDLANLGYPIAEVEKNGDFVITKPMGTGGLVNRQTVTEQILYEIHDPAAYLTPDVILDLTEVELKEVDPDRVFVTGARGRPAPSTLKATVCIDSGYLAEAEISYAGPNAGRRACLAMEIVKERMKQTAPNLQIRADLIGLVSVLGDTSGESLSTCEMDAAHDVRLRLSAQGHDAAELKLLLAEVEALYCAGPAGGSGVRKHLTPRFSSTSCLLERELVTPRVSYFEPFEKEA